jgi:Ca2+-binding RTX toxin-like protein
MVTFTGTTTPDILTGTAQADVFHPYGVGPYDPADYMSGGNGGDTYDLAPLAGTAVRHDYVIDDQGSDGAVDTITGTGALYQSGSNGYVAHVSAIRVGDDLLITTPSKPSAYRVNPVPSFDITIIDQYAGGQVEVLVAGGVAYTLPTGTKGTPQADLMAGTDLADTLSAGGGDDFVIGNGGNDRISGGRGSDQMFGDAGNDRIFGQADNDWIYGGTGWDIAKGGAGNDWIYLEDGNDKGLGQGGNDFIFGQNGNDTLVGGAGSDTMSGGRGNDVMNGGTGGDAYRYGYDVDALDAMADAGHDVISDKGEVATWNDFDRIELFGFYGPSWGSTADAFGRLSFARTGKDMVIDVDGGLGSITVKNQFATTDTQIEKLIFNAAYWTPLEFQILDGAKVNIGDDRRYDSGYGGELNEVMFGTNGNDMVFGNSGTNFIWLGAGADTLIYKQVDPQLLYGIGGGPAHDIVEDFDVSQDMMNFAEVGLTGIDQLTIADNTAGNAMVSWVSGSIEVSDIYIELRGVTAAELTIDQFVFL